MYIWHEYRNAIPLVRSPSNSKGKAGGGLWPVFHGGVVRLWVSGCVGVSGIGMGFMGGGGVGVNWEIMKSSLSWMSRSLFCILRRACSRAMSLLFSMVGNGTFIGDVVQEWLRGNLWPGSTWRSWGRTGPMGENLLCIVPAGDWSSVLGSFSDVRATDVWT